MIVTPAGAAHPAFATTGNPSQDRETWSQMPEFFWAAAGSQLKPGATRLAEIEMAGGKEKLPILAEQFVGRGRVLVVGCDETFRWRRNVGDRIFYRFWGQALRHVARKPAPGGQESWLEVEPRARRAGQPGDDRSLCRRRVEHQPLDQERYRSRSAGQAVARDGASSSDSAMPATFAAVGRPSSWACSNVEFAGGKTADFQRQRRGGQFRPGAGPAGRESRNAGHAGRNLRRRDDRIAAIGRSARSAGRRSDPSGAAL